MQLRGKALEADKTYKVTRWGVGSAQSEGPPVWDVVEMYLKNLSNQPIHTPNVPRLVGVTDNPGIDAATLS